MASSGLSQNSKELSASLVHAASSGAIFRRRGSSLSNSTCSRTSRRSTAAAISATELMPGVSADCGGGSTLLNFAQASKGGHARIFIGHQRAEQLERVRQSSCPRAQH